MNDVQQEFIYNKTIFRTFLSSESQKEKRTFEINLLNFQEKTLTFFNSFKLNIL